LLWLTWSYMYIEIIIHTYCVHFRNNVITYI
jgi:hypothetical protein